jgi:hypothetical protein
MGDIRAVASHIRVQAQQHLYHYQEEITVYEVAQIIQRLQHQCTYQSGIRPLGISCLIFGRDQNIDHDHLDVTHFSVENRPPTKTTTFIHHTNTWKMYKCTPSGCIPEDCYEVGGAVLGYQEDEVSRRLSSFHDVPEDHPNEKGTTNTGTTSTTTPTTTNNDTSEANHVIQFISLMKDTFDTIDHDNETVRMMDVYIFRGDGPTRMRQQYRARSSSTPITCFANIDCRSSNHHHHHAYPNSLMRVRQYYNQP